MSKFTERAYDWFLSQGWSPHAAAALAGNAEAESSGNPKASHDSGTGFGIFGWRNPPEAGGAGRWSDLKKFAADNGLDINDEVTQFKFAQHELTQGNYKAI